MFLDVQARSKYVLALETRTESGSDLVLETRTESGSDLVLKAGSGSAIVLTAGSVFATLIFTPPNFMRSYFDQSDIPVVGEEGARVDEVVGNIEGHRGPGPDHYTHQVPTISRQ